MKAIDIAILPPKEISELCINLNQRLIGPRNIKLNQTNQLPHITLLFGGVEDDKLHKIWNKVEQITRDFKPIKLEIAKVRYGGSTGLHLAKSESLVNLHTQLVNKISPLLSYNVTTKDFANPDTVFERSTTWVNNFLVNSARENYDPHITIGDGKLKEDDLSQLPIKFTADKITLCHLGNLCTCTETLFKTNL